MALQDKKFGENFNIYIEFTMRVFNYAELAWALEELVMQHFDCDKVGRCDKEVS